MTEEQALVQPERFLLYLKQYRSILEIEPLRLRRILAVMVVSGRKVVVGHDQDSAAAISARISVSRHLKLK